MELVEAQGGDQRYVYDTSLFAQAPYCCEVLAQADGYVAHMNTESIGIASSMLGAGRETVDSVIDPAAGILLVKKTGDAVKAGEVIARLYSSKEELLAAAQKHCREAITIADTCPQEGPLVLARVEKGNVEEF